MLAINGRSFVASLAGSQQAVEQADRGKKVDREQVGTGEAALVQSQ